MPIVSAQVYIRNLLDGLAMPGNAPALAAYITPPDPNVDAATPAAYIWPADGEESRNPVMGGTIPRAAFTGAASGFKPVEHALEIYMVWFGQDDDPDSDTWFPGMVDAVMAALRASPDPAIVTDPWTGVQSNLIDVGENMTYRITIRALDDQRYNRYDALITLRLHELIAA